MPFLYRGVRVRDHGECPRLTTRSPCSDVYEPVCGADGMTYANPCKATQAYVSPITSLHNDKFVDENTSFFEKVTCNKSRSCMKYLRNPSVQLGGCKYKIYNVTTKIFSN